MTRVTIVDVARSAGVSKTAVSFAFNYPDRLGQATLDRVLQVAHNMGYAPHPTARALSLQRSGTIGLLVPQGLKTVFANPFTSELIQSLGASCEEHDLTMLLVTPLAGSLEGAIWRAAVDGFISVGLTRSDPALATLRRLGVPTVLVDSEAGEGETVINVDDRGGAQAAAEHLIQLGHRRLALILLPPARWQAGLTTVAARRLAGYRAALAAAGLPEPFTVTASATPEAGARALGVLLADRRRPTAVLAMSDMVAIGLMAAASAAGLRLPDDLSIVGYDDVQMAAWTSPALTTVRQPIAEKGRMAARLLIQRMKGKAVDSPSPLPTSLVVRGSTSKPARIQATPVGSLGGRTKGGGRVQRVVHSESRVAKSGQQHRMNRTEGWHRLPTTT